MQEQDPIAEWNPQTAYIFHRHSTLTATIYYRCSDKRCRARLQYSLRTFEVKFAHCHLEPFHHKPCRVRCAITIQELQLSGVEPPRNPIVVYQPQGAADCASALEVAAVRLSTGNRVRIIRVIHERVEELRRITEECKEKCLASQWHICPKVSVFSRDNLVIVRAAVEIECSISDLPRILQIINNTLGTGTNLSIFEG